MPLKHVAFIDRYLDVLGWVKHNCLQFAPQTSQALFRRHHSNNFFFRKNSNGREMSIHKSLVGHFSADGTGRDSYLTAIDKTENIHKYTIKKFKVQFNSSVTGRHTQPLVLIPERSLSDVHISKAKNFLENCKAMLSSQRQHDEERSKERLADIRRKEADWNERCFQAMRSRSPQPLPLLTRKVILHRTRTLV